MRNFAKQAAHKRRIKKEMVKQSWKPGEFKKMQEGIKKAQNKHVFSDDEPFK